MFKESLFAPGSLVVSCNVTFDAGVSPGKVDSDPITIIDDEC